MRSVIKSYNLLMIDLQEEHTTVDTRAEGLVRDLVAKVASQADAAQAPTTSLFGAFFPSLATPATPSGPLDLKQYMIRPADFNRRIPENLYLVASAGALSWGTNNTGRGADAMDVDQVRQTNV